VGDEAIIRHERLQFESPAAFHMGTLVATCGPKATCHARSFSFGGMWSRYEATVVLAGEGAECTLNGLYLGTGQSLVDTETTIDHAAPHGTSHELVKGILGDQARAVFSGRIVVRPGAQKTDAKQTNKALLLSDEALVNSKPQLEIFANDVKCTHGAAVGQLDDEAIFYLRARGIGAHEARHLLVRAFAGEILDGVDIEPVRVRLEQALGDVLATLL
jgi:Fe-S cluster assembly protein SufD